MKLHRFCVVFYFLFFFQLSLVSCSQPDADETSSPAKPVQLSAEIPQLPVETVQQPDVQETPEVKQPAESIENSIGMKFVLIPAGSFMMGCDPNFGRCDEPTQPSHRVTISKPFYMGIYEVTQAQWVAVMGSNNSKIKGRNYPVDSASWNDAQRFIAKLNEMEGVSAYRLPTEAEWEYAARAGTEGGNFFEDSIHDITHYAWVETNSGLKIHPVGQLKPNPWGLYDIYGNVQEWVNDWWDDEDFYYPKSEPVDPKGPPNGSYKIMRGISCFSNWSNLSAVRDFVAPEKTVHEMIALHARLKAMDDIHSESGGAVMGFRIVREVVED